MMLGPEGVTRLLMGRLHERLPLELASVRGQVGATVEDLPDLQNLRPFVPDIATIEDWPSVYVTFLETNPNVGGSSRLEQSQGVADEYMYRYRNRVYVFARGETQPQTDLRLKRYALALRQACIRQKSLTDQSDPVGPHARIDSTIRETMSEVGLDPSSKRFIGGAYIEVDIVTTEQLGAVEGSFGEASGSEVHPAFL